MIEKGIVDLLEALLLQDQGVNFKAKIAGGIDTEIEKIILPYFDKLSENVEYLGVVYGDQKKNLLDWSNVLFFQPIILWKDSQYASLKLYGNIKYYFNYQACRNTRCF